MLCTASRDGPLGWGKGDLKKVSLHLLWVPRGRATYAEAMGRLKDESRRRERDYSEVCTGLPFGNVRTPDAILDGLLRWLCTLLIGLAHY
jgi:hypothetical protein